MEPAFDLCLWGGEGRRGGGGTEEHKASVGTIALNQEGERQNGSSVEICTTQPISLVCI